MKSDEQHFLVKVFVEKRERNLSPREIINSPSYNINHKRAWYLLEKWSKKGWYDYGVTLDLGWLTLDGKRKAVECAAALQDERLKKRAIIAAAYVWTYAPDWWRKWRR